MPVVYIDVLLGVNLFVNYFLLLAVGRFLHLAVRRLRLLTGAAVGAAFSLSILLPPLPAVLPLLFRLALSLLLILISFPIPTGKRLVQAVLAFYLVSFAFAGFFLALWLLTSAEGISSAIPSFILIFLRLSFCSAACWPMRWCVCCSASPGGRSRLLSPAAWK